MAHRIHSVEPGSIAAQCGLAPGDSLLRINGEAVLDQVDYQFLTAGESIVLEVENDEGISEIHLSKDEAEPLGITFESSLMARPRACRNKCVFCFVDQMPRGMRRSLYVKDDDWRLSLMMGNYITLTNLDEAELARVIARRASPLFISIHATDAAVRARMMGNPAAAEIRERLERLRAAGISFHCQIVLCPGINDGAVLDDTLKTLADLSPAALSAALVPVGLTRHREKLAALEPYTRETSGALVRQAHAWQEKLLARLGTRFVFPADEFYCLSGKPLPEDAEYENYPQLENGVGLLRSFEREFVEAYNHHDPEETKPRRVLIATGISAEPFLEKWIAEHPLPGVAAEVVAVRNDFFGPLVTVAGLLTGQDILRTFRGRHADELLIPEAALRHEDGLFLDDMPLEALRRELPMQLHAAGCDGAEFLYALQGELMEG